MANTKELAKNYFTPCRTVGLKRKSTGTPSPVTDSPKIHETQTSIRDVSNDLEVNSAKSVSNIDEAETPKRTCIRSAPLSRHGLEKFRKETAGVVNQVKSSLANCEETECIDTLDFEIQKIEERIFKKLEEIKDLQLDTLNAKQVHTSLRFFFSGEQVAILQLRLICQKREGNSNHDLEKLSDLTKKWRHACQAVLDELLAEYRARDESCSMMTLLRNLGIPASLVHYNEADMEFHD